MAHRKDIEQLQDILENLHKTTDPPVNSNLGNDLTAILNVLKCPVFSNIVTINESINQLKNELNKHPSILPLDFDIGKDGQLLLNIPPDTSNIVEIGPSSNSDSYEQSDGERHFGKIRESSCPDLLEKAPISHLPTIPTAEPDYVNLSHEISLLKKEAENESREFAEFIKKEAKSRDIYCVQLYKAEKGSLGFSVVGLSSDVKGNLGIFVENISTTGIAFRDGRLQVGDQILAIDGQLLDSDISHNKAIGILQRARGIVEIVVARGPSDYEPQGIDRDKEPSSIAAADPVLVETVEELSPAMVLNTEWAQVEVIELLNDGTGFGFGIIGGRSSGVIVKTIRPGGVAHREGRLQSGDHILQINEVSLRGIGSEQVAQVLRQVVNHVRLIVARPVEPTCNLSALQDSVPIVPTRILSDPEAVDRHLLMFQQAAFQHTKESQPIELPAPSDLLEENLVEVRIGVEEVQTGLRTPTKSISEPAIKQSAICIDNDGNIEPISLLELPEMETFEVELTKDQQGLGITIAGYVCEKEEISGIFVKSIAPGSAADACGKIQINDQIVEVDSNSLFGYTNHQAVEMLRSTGKVVRLCLARYLRGLKFEQLQQAIANAEVNPALVPNVSPRPTLPEHLSPSNTTLIRVGEENTELIPHESFLQQSLPLPTQAQLVQKWSSILGPNYDIVVSQIRKFDESGGMGISLEGTVDLEDGREVRPHHYIRAILPEGPVGLDGKLQSGDEILEVNGTHLQLLDHVEVVALLKELPMDIRIVCARAKGDSGTGIVGMSAKFISLIGSNGGDRLIKAKSDGSLAVGPSSVSVGLALSKSRSLEPLSGLALWSSESQTIQLFKGERGLGFSILDYQDPMSPSETVIVIRSLVPGGVAQQDGRLIPGDRLLFVNDMSLENATLDTAVQALKGAEKGLVRIGVAKPLPLPEYCNSGHKVSRDGGWGEGSAGGGRVFTAFLLPSDSFPSAHRSDCF